MAGGDTGGLSGGGDGAGGAGLRSRSALVSAVDVGPALRAALMSCSMPGAAMSGARSPVQAASAASAAPAKIIPPALIGPNSAFPMPVYTLSPGRDIAMIHVKRAA